MVRRLAISERDGFITTTYPVQSEETGAEGQREHWSMPSASIRWHSLHAKGFLAIILHSYSILVLMNPFVAT